MNQDLYDKIIDQYKDAFKLAEIKHFIPEEFVCKCGEDDCSYLVLDMDFVALLDDFRNDMGFAFRLTSGYRCPLHPAEREKIHPGPHQTGKAVDGAFVGLSAYSLLYGLGMHTAHGSPFMGIGLNQKGDHDTRFIHLDTCVSEPWRPRPHIWTY